MPNLPGVWLDTERGIRRAQITELGAAKGEPKEMDPLRMDNSWKTAVQECTSLHLWAGVMLSVSDWLHHVYEEGSDHAKVGQSKPASPSPAQHVNLDKIEKPEWVWEVPDLSEGSDWHKKQMQSLHLAVKDLTNSEHWLEEGTKALQRHRNNYGITGPKELQLL
jgi:hypothetical protein